MAQNESDSEHSEHEELYKKSTTTNQSKVILDNGKKCGVSYNDGSTTSNLINHLTHQHRILKNNSCRSIKNQFNRTEDELLYLKKAIVYLPSQLQSDENELNDILCGFEEITTLLSRNTYVIISLIYPAISTLVKTLKILLQQSYIESASTDIDELTILDFVEEIIDDMKDIVEIKEVDASLGIIHKTINILVPMITIGMLEKIKKLRFANTNMVIQTKKHLKSLYELECEIHPTPKHLTSLSNIQHNDHNDFKA
ncbi:2915_t:CDS:2, partial [Racocetra persica]